MKNGTMNQSFMYVIVLLMPVLKPCSEYFK